MIVQYTKVMAPFLLCWNTTSEADVSNMKIQIQLSPIPCMFFTLLRIEAERQSENMASYFERVRIVLLNFSMIKQNCTHWHSSTLIKRLQRPNSVCEHSKWVRFRRWCMVKNYIAACMPLFNSSDCFVFLGGFVFLVFFFFVKYLFHATVIFCILL